MAGRFVVLEGVDGVGTTTHARRLAETLEADGVEVVRTREPSDGPIGRLIRSILRREPPPDGSSPSSLNEPSWAVLALLFASDRVQHLQEEITPALDRGATVICDRYYHSSLVYQSTAAREERSFEWVRALNARARVPDLTLLLTVDAEEAARRREERGAPSELFDDQDFQRRVAELYDRLPAMLPEENLHRIDTSAAEETVAAGILSIVRKLGS